MMPPNDGGPAFPYAQRLPSGNIDTVHQNPGLSIRDWFAGMALQGLLAGRHTVKAMVTGITTPNRDMSQDEVSEWTYSYADAMLIARQAG